MSEDNNIEISFFSEWWYQINKPILVSVLSLICIAFFVSLTINPNISKFNSYSILTIFSPQVLYLLVGLILFFIISFFRTEQIKIFSVILFFIFLLLLISTLFFGNEIKGSKRWLDLKYFSLMPIELTKPFLCLTLALILNNTEGKNKVYAYIFSCSIYLLISVILISQPDISQLFLVSAIFFSAIFMSGFSFVILISIIFIGIIVFVGIYFFNFNVQNRINAFIFPDQYDVIQAELSLRAIKSGGLIGVGPGEGTLKYNIPEASSDYIFSVIAEEYGLLGCLILLSIFFIIAYNAFKRIYNDKDHFLQISLFTLVVYFCLQALIHIAVNIRLIPTTGITLPFISYGGTSVLGMSITCGLIMMFSKKRHNKFS